MKKRIVKCAVSLMLAMLLTISVMPDAVFSAAEGSAAEETEENAAEEGTSSEDLTEDDSTDKASDIDADEEDTSDDTDENIDDTDSDTDTDEDAQGESAEEDAEAAEQTTEDAGSLTLSWSAHIQSTGNTSGSGTVGTSSQIIQFGTTGSSKRLEAFSLSLSSSEGGISYQAHVQSVGWQSTKSEGTTAGTTGQSKRIEAIRISLTGDLASSYDIYYRVHVQKYGWLDWASNGNTAGTTGLSLRVEAVQIVLVNKGAEVSFDQNVPYVAVPTLSYSSHVQSYGWTSGSGEADDTQTLGTTGLSKRLEAIKLSLSSSNLSGSITYRAYVQSTGWQSWVSSGSTAGTTGQSKRLEAVQIKLTDQLSEYFDVYYRVHVQSYGWLDWACNGETAGTSGLSYRAEAIQIVLVPKGSGAPGDTSTSYVDAPTLSVQSYLQSTGWQSAVGSGSISGSAGSGKRLEALKISMSTSVSGSISYSAHVQNVGWQSYVSNGAMAGTTGQSKRVEAVKIKLTGEAANYYDIWYRVYVQGYGWLGWASNGSAAGTTGISYRIEAIQVKIQTKGSSAPGSTANCYTTTAYDASKTAMTSKAQSYSSSTGYLILVNSTTNRVGIFTGYKNNWTLKYYWACSTGASSTPTKKGTFKVGSRGYSFGTSSYTCYYYTQFSGNYLFHSVLYYAGTFNIKNGTLGANISHGCVRLAIDNAKWIYNNIPKNTTVVSY